MRATISKPGFNLGSASAATTLTRQKYASAVPGKPGSSSGFSPVSLASVAVVIQQLLAPPPPLCITAIVYNGGTVDMGAFSTIYDGDGIILTTFTLFDGGLPSTNFC